jgi:hypothetical protein
MSAKLDKINVPSHDILHGDSWCINDDHKYHIETYYCDIVEAVLYADNFLPRTVVGSQKSCWSATLRELKNKSMDCHNHWKVTGLPRSRPVFDCKLDCHYKYKIAVRNAPKLNKEKNSEQLFENLLNKDSVSFWKT